MTFNKLLFLILFALACFTLRAQTLTATTNTPTVKSGTPFTVTVTLAGQATPTITVLNALHALSPGLSMATPLVAAAAQAAQKTIGCTAPPLIAECVVYGLGVTPMANGPIYTAVVTPTTPGPATVKLSSVAAVSGAANVIPLTPGPDLVVTVTPKEDLNGDGVIDVKDVLITVTAVLTNTCTPAVDVNGDGKCDIVDVQLVATNAH